MYGYPPDPLLASAMTALEREARDSTDAARLLAVLEDLPCWSWKWHALEVLNRFDCEGPVRSRPVLMAVLLKQLSAAFPVPMSLLH